MENRVYLSDRQEGFKSHKSLSDVPTIFETNMVLGCVFYLPSEGTLGGDTFIVRGDDYITVSLLEDMAGHGIKAREALLPFIDDLERIAYTASCNKFPKKGFVKEIAKLDKKLDADHLLALSFVRVLSDGTLCYLNEGENQMIIYKDSQAYILDKISHGKLGIFNLIIGDEKQITQKIIPYNTQLSSGDRVLICSDGVVEYIQDMSHRKKKINEIKDSIGLPISLVDIIRGINESAHKELREREMEMPLDDYTLIGLEIK